MLTNQDAIASLAKEAEASLGLTPTQDQDDNTDETEESFGIRVFVYGTLKMGHSNHKIIGRHLPKEAIYLGRCKIRGPYTMVDLGYFPGLVMHQTVTSFPTEIWGEVYRINEEILTHLDILEGNGHFYTRQKVETPWKKAWCYFVPNTYLPKNRANAVVTSGVWKPSDEESNFIKLEKAR